MRHLLNKRFCRKFSEPNLRFPKGCGILHCEQIKYVIRTAIKNIGGKRTLVLYLFSTEQAAKGTYKPTYVMFQTKEDFLTLENMADGSVKWRESSLSEFKRDYRFERGCAFYRSKDEDTVKRFCGKDGLSGLLALHSLQSAIQAVKSIERREKKELAVLRRMESVPRIPQGLNGYIHRKILPQYIFYDYKRTKKPIEGYCTACKHEVMITGQKHLKKGVCPRCKKEITYKSRGKRGYFFDRTSVQVIQRTGEQELIIRIFKIYNDYYGEDMPAYSFFESSRTFISWTQDNNIKKNWYYNSFFHRGRTPWVSGIRPRGWPWQHNFNGDCCAHLYYHNLDEVLSNTPWQYSQLKSFVMGLSEKLEVIPYLEAYRLYPALEYLVKLKLYRLASSVVYRNEWNYSKLPINLNGKNVQEVLGISKKHLPFFQQINPQGKQFRMFKEMIANGHTPDVAMAKWCVDQNVSDGTTLSTLLTYMSNYKLIRYADEQYMRFKRKSWNDNNGKYFEMKDMLTEYRDYLIMAEQLEFDLKNDFVLFPRNLHEAHDNANTLFNALDTEVYDEALAKSYADLVAQYQYKKDGLMIVPPHSAKEIVEEGHKLHHCVGSYVKRVIKKQTIILFVRQTELPEKPFCTVELRDGAVAQARMMENRNPPPKVKAFLDEWKEKVLDIRPLTAAA